MSRQSFVVTGGAGGIGRALVERLARDGHVVVIDLAEDALAWAPEGLDASAVIGDAGDEAVADRAAEAAERAAPLAGWVNNAAVFRDADLDREGAGVILDLVGENLAPAVAGCAAAVRHWLRVDRPGAVVNVSSHQAQRPVAGALAYATAKAAVEGLTRALAVDYGPRGIRANAVALGSIVTARYEALVSERPAVEDEVRRLHPVGRAGRPEEVAGVVAHLLSADASYVNGAIVPVDGGRSVLGLDPEAREPGR